MEKETCSTCNSFTPPSICAEFPTDKSADSRCYLWDNGKKNTVLDISSAFGTLDSIPERIENINPLPVAQHLNVNPSNSISPHETWSIIDATKLETFMECPRRFFFKYVLGWEGEAPSHDLEFGSAWHLAMEHLLLNDYGISSINEAHRLFRNHYERYFPIEIQADLEPKSSSGALLGLTGYCSEYAGDHANFDVLYTEIAGSITVLKDRVVHFRMDTVIRDQLRGVCSLEHKTAKSLERTFQDKWILHMQPNLYTHVLYCLFPADEVYGVIINGTALYKQGPRTKNPPAKFLRVPCRRTPEMMNTWLHNLDRILDDLYHEYYLLSQASDSDDTMVAFQQRTTSCTDYWGCRYHDFCIGWSNPIRYCNDVPTGFVQRFWNPANPTDKPAPKYEFVDGKLVKKEVRL